MHSQQTPLAALVVLSSLMGAAVELLELEVLISHQVQRALLELEPDDTLRVRGGAFVRRSAGSAHAAQRRGLLRSRDRAGE